MSINFTKMTGLGNDYIYVDLTTESITDPESSAKILSDRHFGIGGDGLVLIDRGEKARYKMIMYNADGSRSEMCGNALRCVALFLYKKQYERDLSFSIETDAGVLPVKLMPDHNQNTNVNAIKTSFGEPELDCQKIPVSGYKNRIINEKFTVDGIQLYFTAVNMGNPHCVIFLTEANLMEILGLSENAHLSVDDFEFNAINISSLGAKIENNRIFPNRTNVEFVQILNRKKVKQRTWERGSGETLACGTGAAAVCVASHLNNLTDREITVELLGGSLNLNWEKSDNQVYQEGPAEFLFEGKWLKTKI